MKHLGDITKIHGDQIEPVDCITFGSPCQDLSIAGNRKGLAGERSGLFMEAVRIIKEMRGGTDGRYPTFAIWENVPGAFSSNKGEDFRAVLEELAGVEEPGISIPRPSGDKWLKSGTIIGEGWSLAWRQLDAQYWGVPQRRKRIALVADFGGQRAAEILFEHTSLSGNSDASIPTWQAATGLVAERSTGNDSMVEHESRAYSLKIRSGCAGGGKGALVQTEKIGTLSTLQDQTLFQAVPVFDQDGGHHTVVFDARGNGNGQIVPTITGDHENRITDYTAVAIEQKNFAGLFAASRRQNVNGYKVFRVDTPTLENGRTPKGKSTSLTDTPRYKALGNSIALPQWWWIVNRLRPYMREDPTLGSLFDGIGGFPLVWETAYGKGTARWASEIEEFPIAVTKKWFKSQN